MDGPYFFRGPLNAQDKCCVLQPPDMEGCDFIASAWTQAGGSAQTCSTAMAVAIAESCGLPDAFFTHTDKQSHLGSVDRGLFQLNSIDHSLVSDACAADPLCSSQAVLNATRSGLDFRAWTTYSSGISRQFEAFAHNRCTKHQTNLQAL